MNGIIDEKFYEERLVRDYESTRANLDEIMDELDVIRADAGVREVMGPDFAEWFRASCAEIKRRSNDAFNVVVIGDFKRGKSSLVNAILGSDVVHANVTPETVTINRVSYGEKNTAEAVLANGRKISLSPDETARENLEQVMSRLPAEISYIDIKIPDESLKDIRIVDTPGVGDILKRFDAQVSGYITSADAIIYVVSALSPLSEMEQAFLCAAILPQNMSKLFVVINMCDAAASEEEVSRVTGLITERISRIFPDNFIYPVSALDEICRRKGAPRPNPELAPFLEKSFASMKSALETEILDKRDMIRLERETGMLLRLFKQAGAKIAMLESALEIEAGQHASVLEEYRSESGALNKELESQRRKIHAETRTMKAEAAGWMKAFMSRLKTEIEGAKSFTLEQLEKHFHFFFIDVIRSAFANCSEAHENRLSELIESGLDTAWGEVSHKSVSRKISSVYQGVVWTGYDAASLGAVAISAAVPQLGLLSLIGQAVIGFAKSSGTEKIKAGFVDSVLAHYDEITAQVMDSMGAIYADFDNFADEQLENSYRNRLEESVSAIKQAGDISSQGDSKRQEIRNGLEKLKTGFGALETRLAG
jgi:tRNA U34 5-carboxymethylaminomethyl modifying GTPase MnmE/TrmE